MLFKIILYSFMFMFPYVFKTLFILPDTRGLITFTLSVGNSSDRTDHRQCASHSGIVVSGTVVNKSCTATGRYVSYKRTESGEPRLTALCEVVVIGHPHICKDISPKRCLGGSRYNPGEHLNNWFLIFFVVQPDGNKCIQFKIFRRIELCLETRRVATLGQILNTLL